MKRAPEAEMYPREELLDAKELFEELSLEEQAELPKDRKSVKNLIIKLRSQMLMLAKKHEFEKAALIRDKIAVLEKYILSL